MSSVRFTEQREEQEKEDKEKQLERMGTEKVDVSEKRRERMLANIQEKMILEKEEERKDRRRRQRHH